MTFGDPDGSFAGSTGEVIMFMNFRRATSIGCVTLAFLSAAGCSAGMDGDAEDDIETVQQASCLTDYAEFCGRSCVNSSDPTACYDQCMVDHCGGSYLPPTTPTPPPTTTPPVARWPWSVQCEGRVWQGPYHNDYVSVTSDFEGGPPMTWDVATQLASLATASCEQLQRDHFKTLCATLDRSEVIYVSMGRTFGGIGSGPILVSYDWGVPIISTRLNIADICPVRTTPPDRPCKRRPCP